MRLTFSLLDAPAAGMALWVLLAALVIASVTDLRGRRIPNWLTFSAALAGIGLHLVLGGVWPFLGSLLSCLCAFGLGLSLYTLWGGQGFGAGDAKMIMAAAALWGFWPSIWLFFASNLCMAFLYLPLRWLMQGTLIANGKRLGTWLLSIVVALLSRAGLAPRGAHIIHFVPVGMEDRTPHAPFMLLGALAVLWSAHHGVLPW